MSWRLRSRVSGASAQGRTPSALPQKPRTVQAFLARREATAGRATARRGSDIATLCGGTRDSACAWFAFPGRRRLVPSFKVRVDATLSATASVSIAVRAQLITQQQRDHILQTVPLDASLAGAGEDKGAVSALQPCSTTPAFIPALKPFTRVLLLTMARPVRCALRCRRPSRR